MKPKTKVAELHDIDDGTKTDDELARIVGAHVAYVRSVRDKAKRRMAKANAKRLK